MRTALGLAPTLDEEHLGWYARSRGPEPFRVRPSAGSERLGITFPTHSTEVNRLFLE